MLQNILVANWAHGKLYARIRHFFPPHTKHQPTIVIDRKDPYHRKSTICNLQLIKSVMFVNGKKLFLTNY